MPTISPQHLSIILTTSAIKSHPSTYVIDSSIQSIQSQPTLKDCHVYIICDGAKISPHEQNKYKSGIISQQAFQNYQQFKEILKKKYGERKDKFTIIERQFRCGFAQNIRWVMENYAKTQHVMIYQHDYVIEYEIPFDQVVQVMRKHPKEINYVSFMNSSYTTVVAKMQSIPKVKTYLLKLLEKEENYNLILRIKEFTSDMVEFFRNKFGLGLIPLNFWYDKLHIASRQYYLNVIFNQKGNWDPNRGKNMKTVTFVEDTFGHCMKWTIDEEPQTMQTKFCAYILWDDKNVFYHQSGRTFVTEEAKQQYRINGQKKNAHQSSSGNQDIQLGDFDHMMNLDEKQERKQ